jgi:hypothetical protein
MQTVGSSLFCSHHGSDIRTPMRNRDSGDALRRLVANLWCDGVTLRGENRTTHPGSSVSARLLQSSSGPTLLSNAESRVYAAAVTRRRRATG